MPRGNGSNQSNATWFDEAFSGQAMGGRHLGVTSEYLEEDFKALFGPDVTKADLRKYRISESIISQVDLPEGEPPGPKSQINLTIDSDQSQKRNGLADPSSGIAEAGSDTSTGGTGSIAGLSGKAFYVAATGICVTYDDTINPINIASCFWLSSSSVFDCVNTNPTSGNPWYQDWFTLGYPNLGRASVCLPVDATITKVGVNTAAIGVKAGQLTGTFKWGSHSLAMTSLPGLPASGSSTTPLYYSANVSESLPAGSAFDMYIDSVTAPSGNWGLYGTRLYASGVFN